MQAQWLGPRVIWRFLQLMSGTWARMIQRWRLPTGAPRHVTLCVTQHPSQGTLKVVRLLIWPTGSCLPSTRALTSGKLHHLLWFNLSMHHGLHSILLTITSLSRFKGDELDSTFWWSNDKVNCRRMYKTRYYCKHRWNIESITFGNKIIFQVSLTSQELTTYQEWLSLLCEGLLL